MNAKQKWMIGGAFALVVVLVAAAFAWFAGSDATEPTPPVAAPRSPRAFSAGQQRGNRIRGPHHRSGRSESDDSEQSCGNDPSAARLRAAH
ncbi:hypothetical protein HYG77_38025 (plasmid) [Rhodococcus sp. ZPP]|uniref:hypothetical protein n=1 Tax=Rhodococcus sp. ZPP TaxID=2749906 RepID=UPI001AD893BA|nr:hypothetical protein [Rhodococcus sp. ZPP]QTJ71252.1 hypothetical protein HYG77_38025 [Rhodococcus sp. ZPP]